MSEATKSAQPEFPVNISAADLGLLLGFAELAIRQALHTAAAQLPYGKPIDPDERAKLTRLRDDALKARLVLITLLQQVPDEINT